jgi:hypothetical protein
MALRHKMAFGDHAIRVQRRLSEVKPVSDQRLGDAGWGASGRQSQPQVPVGDQSEAHVEATHGVEQVGADDDIRGACRHEVLLKKARQQFFRGGGRFSAEDHTSLIDLDRSRVHPAAAGCVGCAQLQPEFLGTPQIIIVQERDPRSTCRLGSHVPRGRNAYRPFVAQHSDPPIVEEANRVRRFISRTIIDNQHLEVDRFLRKRTINRAQQQRAPIMSWDHDRNGWRHCLLITRTRCLDGTDSHDRRKERIVDVEFGATEFFERHSGEECDTGQNIAMRPDSDMLRPERLTEQLGTGGGCKAPVVGCHVWRICDTAQGGHGSEQHTTGLKDAMGVTDRGIGSIDVLQGLRENEAVEGIGR